MKAILHPVVAAQLARGGMPPRAPGPAIDTVRDFEIPGRRGAIPVRLHQPNGARGAIVALHGGGWRIGSRDSYDATARNLANDSGQAVFTVDYRLAPENRFPVQFEDALDATTWIADHAEDFGLEPGRLAVHGESAGGNLAAAVCLYARDHGGPSIRFQSLVYPATDARLVADTLDEFDQGCGLTKADFASAWRGYGLGELFGPDDWRASPLHAQSHAGLPPALILSARCDGMFDDAAAYALKLQGAGVEAVHVTYEGMVHMFFHQRQTLAAARMAQKQVAMTLRDALLAELEPGVATPFV